MRNLGTATRESPQAATKTQHSQKTNKQTERRGIDGSRREAKQVCGQGGRGWEAAGQEELGQCQWGKTERAKSLSANWGSWDLLSLPLSDPSFLL